MKQPSTTTCALLAVGLLLVLGVAQADPVAKLVKPAYIKAARLFPQPSNPDDTYTLEKIPVFPGTKFYSTVCGGPNVDRTAYVDATKISYTQNRGPSGNSMKIVYFFKDAKLEVVITETYKEKVLVKDVTSLAALMDNASDQQIQRYTAGARKAAIAAIDTLITHLTKFTVRNQEAACMAYLQSDAKNPDQPYSPKLKTTITYLNKIKTSLKSI